MNQSNTNTTSSLTGSTGEAIANTAALLDNLIKQVRSNIESAKEPKAQALFETTAEVLIGLKKAYDDYKGGGEKAWQ